VAKRDQEFRWALGVGRKAGQLRTAFRYGAGTALLWRRRSGPGAWRKEAVGGGFYVFTTTNDQTEDEVTRSRQLNPKGD
jgi:hypothetical protein